MSCCNIITQTDFYGVVPLSKNVESENIQIAINNVEATYVAKLICKPLHDELCQQITDNELTPANTELLTYLKKVLVCYAFADLMFFHPVQVTKESVVRKVTDESEFVDFDTNEKQAMYWRQMGKNYASQMNDWLELNVALNPLYDQDSCNNCEDKQDLGNWGIS